ncbi:MAG: inositol monophosphatase family protein [Candidatus Woesearchaeota archaeon]
MKELKTAIYSARQAGRILLKHYGKVSHEYKADKSFVTRADREAEQKIKEILMKKFPNHSFLGEETGSHGKSDYVWVVDPLDGTTNFIMMNPFFNTSIALFHNNKPILGVVYNPLTKEMFYAQHGKGAFLNNTRIHISNRANFEETILTFCHNKDKNNISRFLKTYSTIKPVNHNIRQLGAAALELCYVAAGRIDAFFMFGANPWDVGAGSVIAREAGAKVTDFENREFSLSSHDIIATNPELLGKLLAVINKFK